MILKEMLKKEQYDKIWNKYCGFLNLSHGRIYEDSESINGRADTVICEL